MCENQEDLGDPAIIRAEALYVSPNVVFHLCAKMSDTGRRHYIQTHRWTDTLFVEISTQKFSRQPVALDRAEITDDHIPRFTDNRCQEEEVQRLVFLKRFDIREHGFELAQGRLDLEFILWCQCLRLLGENQPRL